MKIGDTIEVLDEYLSIVEPEVNKPLDRLDRFVTKIEVPRFERMPQNKNEETFDYIFVSVNIISKWHEDRFSYFQKHKKDITKMVFEKIERNKKFQKFGVPLNFLRVSRVTLKRNSVIEFVLELKI